MCQVVNATWSRYQGFSGMEGDSEMCSFIRGSKRIVKSSLLQNKLSSSSLLSPGSTCGAFAVWQEEVHTQCIDLFILLQQQFLTNGDFALTGDIW